MATLVTFESVAAAAEVIVVTGKRPSVRTIAAALGGGSPNSILVHLRDWQSWRPVAGIADIDIDAQIIDGIKKQIQMTAARAAATAEEKAASTEDDLQAVSAEQAEAKQQITTLIDELDKSKYQVNALTKQIDTERADAERFAQTAQIAYAAMREDIATERQKSETIAAALVRSEVRLEALPKLESKMKKMEAEIETLRAAFDSMQQAKQQAEQAIAIANANLNAANQRAQDLLERLNKAEAKVEGAAKESVSLNFMLQAEQARIEAAVKEIEVLKKAEQKVTIEPKVKVGRPSKNPAKHPTQPDGNHTDYETMPLALQA